MKYLKYTYVSTLTGKNIFYEANPGPVKMPNVIGLEYSWARESQYPTFTPEIFGTCPDDSDTNVEGVLEVMSQEAWEVAKQQELDNQFNCPKTLSAKQMRLAFLDAGLLDQVEALVKTLSKDLQIIWDYDTVIYRNSPLIKQLATQLNLLEFDEFEVSKIDKIFQKGEQL
jgi:hypothetical protein